MKRKKVIEVLGLYLMLENISQRRVELLIDTIADELLADEPAGQVGEKVNIDTKINLCSTCIHDIPTCKGKPKFGNGIGNDNVIQCIEYSKLRGECKCTEPPELNQSDIIITICGRCNKIVPSESNPDKEPYKRN